MALVKSHSNYVLKSRHQEVNDGTIYERDITTIGGVNQFAKGMTPIYRSNNFIITVRNDNSSTNVFNNTNWERNDSGTVWTLKNVSGLTSDNEDANDMKIVLKQDYYDFCDFAYYGSLSELFRASITDIIDRFPGELYCTSNNIYYTVSEVIDKEVIEDRVMLGKDSLNNCIFNIDNPFGIDLHSKVIPKNNTNPLKYFADGGYENYLFIDGKNNHGEIQEWSAETYNDYCKGDRICKINTNVRYVKEINGKHVEEVKDYIIEGYIGDDGKIFYLGDESMEGLHIRPNEKYITEFYNKCDNFQKILMNRKTTPLYKATFSVLGESKYGLTKSFETFIFPTTYGDYNIIADEYGFSDYTSRLIKIGEFYDSNITDNIYRAMTHEAIKNFDWTYTREYTSGEEEEYVLGGHKIQKALRVIGREFDEIKAYIDNIKNICRASYDDRGNMPDYFLKDSLADEGWDIKLVYPYEGKVNNEDCKFVITSQDRKVRPYSSDIIDENTDKMNKFGFFMYKGDKDNDAWNLKDNEIPKKYNDTDYHFAIAVDEVNHSISSGSTWYRCTVRNRIRPYVDNKEYSYHEMSNLFLKRLKLNSRHIWRHKGTIDGVEMILGMFGLKSQRFCDASDDKELKADYKITEYSWSTRPLEDTKNCLYDMFNIDWINSTKNIIYDYRGVSNYTNTSAASDYIPYQGLPVEYIEVEKDKRRLLYPSFNKDEKYDGDPYFQMKGGWQEKTYDDGNGNKCYFQFNDDSTKIVSSTTTPIFKETLKTIKSVNFIGDLLATPSENVLDGAICYVVNVNNNLLIIDDTAYDIYTEDYTDENGVTVKRRYVKMVKEGGYIKATSDKFFTDDLTVFDIDLKPHRYDIYNSENGLIVRAYINENPTKDGGNEYSNRKFLCISDNDGEFEISSVTILENGNGYSNYFYLDNAQFSHMMATEYAVVDSDDKTIIQNGWRRLKYSDEEYRKISTLTNYFNGNNPHNGNLTYDNGYEYFKYFKTLFKYACEEELFDDRCHDNVYDLVQMLQEDKYGFSGLTEENYKNLDADTKIHYFGNYSYLKKDEKDNLIYTEIPYKKINDMDVGKYGVEVGDKYIIKEDINKLYKNIDGNDPVTNQIINTKRIGIEFFIDDDDDFGDDYKWSQIKYIDDIIMGYLTQMIPSTAILSINYSTRNK